jgi:hypothetical protein
MTLLLEYIPDRQLRYSQHRRGWPTSDVGFHPCCNTCDGYGTVYGWAMEGFDPLTQVLPRTGWVECSCCGGSGFADHVLQLNTHLMWET